MFGICNLAIVPVRLEASDRSEQVTQLLFGEHFKILDHQLKWTKIEIAFDNYQGWIDNKQFQFMPYPNRDHGIRDSEATRLHLQTLFTRYLKQHCPPGAR